MQLDVCMLVLMLMLMIMLMLDLARARVARKSTPSELKQKIEGQLIPQTPTGKEMTRMALALSFLGSSDWPCSSGFNAGELKMRDEMR